MGRRKYTAVIEGRKDGRKEEHDSDVVGGRGRVVSSFKYAFFLPLSYPPS